MSTDKTMAQNTVLLYLRVFVTMCINFYASRAILQILGIEDFGIYNLVGGVVSSFAFISDTITSANARFLSFSIGLDKKNEIKRTFSLCWTSSLIIAVLLVILCETVGLWWMVHKINIPPGKVEVAQWIFHIAVVNFFVSLAFTPFNAIVIAYEKMNVYAVMSVLTSVLSLVVVFLLKQNHGDLNNAVLYSFLLLVINAGSGVFYIVYAQKKFQSVSYQINWGQGLKELFTYSSWDLYGNLSVTARTSGVAILQNMFFGVGINAAIGIANQVQGIVTMFSANVLFAAKPRVIKYYASEAIEGMLSLMHKTTKYSTLLLCMVMLPFIVEMDFVLKMWLGILPDYTSALVKWFLLFIIGANISQCLLMGIHATSKLKKSSLINGTLYLIVLPLTFYGFRNGGSPVLPYIINVLFIVFGGLLNAVYFKKEVPQFRISTYYVKAVLPVLALSMVDYGVLVGVKSCLINPYAQFLAVGSISVLIMSISSWFLIMENKEKHLVSEKWKGLWSRN